VNAHFTLTPEFQFDQAGAILYFDQDNWIKTGIEFVDGNAKASVVVTLNGYSDWSTFPWNSCENEVRLHRMDESVAIEMKEKGKEDWHFIRISPWFRSNEKNIMGAYCCRPSLNNPTKEGGMVRFHQLEVKESVSKAFHHTY